MLRRFNPSTQHFVPSAGRSRLPFLFGESLPSSPTSLQQCRFITNGERDDLTRVVSGVQSEAKGQKIDLDEMAQAARKELKSIQEAQKRVNFDDPRLKAKVSTLQTALKAYSSRITNVQTEAVSLQADAEKVLKLLYGNNSAEAGATADSVSGSASTASTASSSKTTEAEGEEEISVDPPQMAKKLEEINSQPAGTPLNPTDSSSSSSQQPAAETVSEEEIVVESVDGDSSEAAADGPSSSSSSSTSSSAANEAKAEETSIAEITTILHEKGIDFSDCREAKSLRQRYKEFLDGMFDKPAAATSVGAANQQKNTDQPRGPQQQANSGSNNPYAPPQGYQTQEQFRREQESRSKAPPSNETSLAHDPNPGALRKQIDTSRYVRDVKAEIAKDNGLQPDQVDLWSGMVLLEDHRRLYEYPGLANNPIEVRQKGDIPRKFVFFFFFFFLGRGSLFCRVYKICRRFFFDFSCVTVTFEQQHPIYFVNKNSKQPKPNKIDAFFLFSRSECFIFGVIEIQ